MSDNLTYLLSLPLLYNFFTDLVGGRARRVYASEYIRATEGDRVLDLGCGTAQLRRYLPRKLRYVGVDASESYITHARRMFSGENTFIAGEFGVAADLEPQSYDIVLATGLIHHLADDDARSVFEIADRALIQGGKMITLDGAYVAGQSRLARHLLDRDRGKHVRTAEIYERLARQVFRDVEVFVRHDLMRIPYSHAIMICRK